MGYPFPEDQYKTWHAITSGEAQMSHEQRVVSDITRQALEKGLFYNVDVYRFVLENVPEGFFTQEDIEKQPKGNAVEHGCIGTEVYYARRILEAQIRLQSNREAVKNLSVGLVLKNERLKGHSFSSLTITSLTPDGDVELAGVKRGTKKRWTIKLEAIHPIFKPQPQLTGPIIAIEMDRFGYMVARNEPRPATA